MASSKSFVLLLCALLVFVLIASAEASTSYEESDKTVAVDDQDGGSGSPDGEYPADAQPLKCKRMFCCRRCHRCRRGFCCRRCRRCCV